MPARRPLRQFLLFLLWLALTGLSGWLALQWAQRAGIAELRATGTHRLDLYGASLQREIAKYAFLPGVLELEGNVLGLLQAPDTPGLSAKVNAYLEQLNARAGTLAVYVITPQGRVVGASNWRRADSYFGEDLSFRPYFRDAMATGTGRLFGIGTTRGEPGYYLATALGEGANPLGVAVVKVSLDQLEQSWATVEAPVVVSDEHGVVILSSVGDWKFRTLQPLDAALRDAFDTSMQYNRRPLVPLGLQILRDLGQGARLVQLRGEQGANAALNPSVYPVAGRFLAQSRMLPGTPWTLSVLSHLEQVDQIALSRAWVAAIGAAFVCLLGLLYNERRRHLRDRLAAREALQAAHDELERKVARRTAALSSANQSLRDEVAERIRAEATLRAAQDELVQAGKLAVIGQLSTGIAHELNQPLTALRTLSGNSQRFLDRGDVDTTRVNLQRMAQLADRMGRITGQLRNFARKSSGAPQAVPLSRALDNALSVLEPRVAETGAAIVRHSEGEDPLAWCDGNRIEQVLVNLINNSLDAMRGQAAPQLELACAVHEGQAQVTVRDHGLGLSDAAQQHLFQPFFTTKEAGAGLGLGLALSAGIVRECGGTLTGANHADGGAVFTLRLPLAPTPSST